MNKKSRDITVAIATTSKCASAAEKAFSRPLSRAAVDSYFDIYPEPKVGKN